MKKKSFLRQALFIYILALALVSLSFYTQAQEPAAKEKESVSKTAKSKTTATKDKRNKDMFAVFDTNKGTFKIKLFSDKAPKTVENFVGLAEGTAETVDPFTGKKQKKPFFDGTKFHRVVKGFMIQGGDPKGDSTGGPGYPPIKDEFGPGLNFEKPGMVAMANAGPNTAASQFFITVANTSFLSQGGPKYAIFGEVVEGYNVVENISKVPVSGEKPIEDVIVKSVKILK